MKANTDSKILSVLSSVYFMTFYKLQISEFSNFSPQNAGDGISEEHANFPRGACLRIHLDVSRAFGARPPRQKQNSTLMKVIL